MNAKIPSFGGDFIIILIVQTINVQLLRQLAGAYFAVQNLPSNLV
jgi:hypothetical protein